MTVTEIYNTDDLQKTIDTKQDVLIDFFAKWCAPCMQGAPIFEAKSNEYKNTTFIKFNIDNMSSDEQEEWCITSIPALKHYKNKNLVHDEVGGLNHNTLKRILTT